MIRDQLIGVWRLMSYEFRLADGILIRPMGEGVQGILIYTANGYVSLHIFDPERPKFAADDFMKGAPEEVQQAFEGSMAYYGTFEVDEQKAMVIHHVQGCTFPNWVGVDRVQFYEFVRDQLLLTTLPMSLSGEQVVGQLTFKRVK
jgi:hypothetical protein